MLAKAFIAVTVSGRKNARKIRKIAAASPTPNHRIYMGIEARGEVECGIWINRFSDIAARRRHPISNPNGIAIAAATQPQVTRNREATTYFNNRSRSASSRIPRATAMGSSKILSRCRPAA
jgi:hypothetical protein